MKKNASLLVSLLLLAVAAHAAEVTTTNRWIVKGTNGANQAIPISMKGFTGEVDAVLRFDLGAQGFEFVADDAAYFLVTGKNDGNVEGHVRFTATKQELLGKAYAGGSPRTQAHALADDIVLAVTGKKGIGLTKIAFKRETGHGADGVMAEIIVADFDGHNGIAVTSDNVNTVAPAWVPGHRVLYYTSYKLGNPDIFRQDLTSGARSVIARHSGLNTSAALSPDGAKVAMVLSKSGAPNIWIANADGTGLRQLTTTPDGDSSPCWSPDGRTICFSSRARGASTLFTVPAAGGTPKWLQTVGARNATEPDWSPDGTQIAFTRQAGAFEICVVPAGGGEAKVLTAGEDPSWAPNSRTVIFARRANGKRTLSLLDVPTQRVKDLPRILGSSSQPAWAK
ncbi:MAG: PD40 domain-containing protein [Verrucomicrobia bacterium]|nr:PD40 domain-containing protein [Verrucomicrobiota bacterium]